MDNILLQSAISYSHDQHFSAIFKCFFFATAYVGILHFKRLPYPRDHPETIKQRIRRVTILCILSPLLMWIFSANNSNTNNNSKTYSVWTWLGLHTNKLFIAALYPLLLTMILFTGPIVLQFIQGRYHEIYNDFKQDGFSFLTDLIWHRTYVAAPITEELIFRACMLPLLVPCFGVWKSTLLAPLFFGLAHLHHVIEQLRGGHPPKLVWLQATFQMMYTSIFGAYSAFIFLRTGHLIGPVLCHSFCNFMGFPEFGEIPDSGFPKLICSTFIFGLLFFWKMMFIMTSPDLFESIYWT